MLLQDIITQCKSLKNTLHDYKMILISQLPTNHGDFITINYLLHQLSQNKTVCFITFRQNYAHYLSLSKKQGNSIQPYLKKNLIYYELFQHQYCSELPLTQTSPQTYSIPPNIVRKIKISSLLNQIQNIPLKSTVIIDAISYIDNQMILSLYQISILRQCRIIFGGCKRSQLIYEMLKKQADYFIEIDNDVANHGKFKLVFHHIKFQLLWKWIQGKYQLSQHLQL